MRKQEAINIIKSFEKIFDGHYNTLKGSLRAMKTHIRNGEYR